MKEIHFYKDGLIESCYGWYLTHNSTMSAIEANNPCIYTTAISALDLSYLLDKGYEVTVFDDGEPLVELYKEENLQSIKQVTFRIKADEAQKVVISLSLALQF